MLTVHTFFVPLVESGICLLVDVATLSTIYDVRHPLLLPPGYPTQELISRPQAVRHPSSTPTLAACISFLHYINSTLLSIAHIYHLNLRNTAHAPFPAFRPPFFTSKLTTNSTILTYHIVVLVVFLSPSHSMPVPLRLEPRLLCWF